MYKISKKAAYLCNKCNEKLVRGKRPLISDIHNNHTGGMLVLS